MLDNLNFSITVEEVLYVAIASFFVTWFIITIRKIKFIMTKVDPQIASQKKDIQLILERCYTLFPTDNINFQGNIIKRGMKIKVTTLQNKVFEGEFIGTNSKNMVCIITNKLVIAYEINNIEKISLIEN